MSQSSATSSSKLGSFDPFALHPFTNGSALASSSTSSAPRPITSSPFNQAGQYNQGLYMPQPRRGDPTTPPAGPGPQRPLQQQPVKAEPIFTSYKADGRRTPELEDLLLKRSGSRWPLENRR